MKIYEYTRVFICKYTHTHTHTHTHIYIYIYAWARTHRLAKHTNTNVTRMNRIPTPVCAYTSTHTHTRTHTYKDYIQVYHKSVHWRNGSGIHQCSRRSGFNPRSNHSETQKIVFDASLLNTQHYKLRIKGKQRNLRKEGIEPSPSPRCSSY